MLGVGRGERKAPRGEARMAQAEEPRARATQDRPEQPLPPRGVSWVRLHGSGLRRGWGVGCGWCVVVDLVGSPKGPAGGCELTPQTAACIPPAPPGSAISIPVEGALGAGGHSLPDRLLHPKCTP